MITLIDYGAGNAQSVINAVEALGGKVTLTHDKRKIKDSSHIILPGVGAFGSAITKLRALGIIETLAEEVLDNKKPFLGVCLGMQLLAKKKL